MILLCRFKATNVRRFLPSDEQDNVTKCWFFYGPLPSFKLWNRSDKITSSQFNKSPAFETIEFCLFLVLIDTDVRELYYVLL